MLVDIVGSKRVLCCFGLWISFQVARCLSLIGVTKEASDEAVVLEVSTKQIWSANDRVVSTVSNFSPTFCSPNHLFFRSTLRRPYHTTTLPHCSSSVLRILLSNKFVHFTYLNIPVPDIQHTVPNSDLVPNSYRVASEDRSDRHHISQ